MSASRSNPKRKKPTRKKTKRRPSFFLRYGVELFLGAVIIALVSAIWFVVSKERVEHGDQYIESEVDEVQRPGQIREETVVAIAPTPADRLDIPDVVSAPSGPRIALIIDDLGADPVAAERIMALDAPIAFSILPHLRFSNSIAKNAAERGKVVMLHLPMEPRSSKINPGPGALLMGQSDEKTMEELIGDLEAVPGVVGVNNHMGSLYTESGEKTHLVMAELKKRGLFFVDSRTTAETVAYDTALRYGVPAAERDVFLDNDLDVRKISEMILSLADEAIKKGSAIGIGHPHEETIKALEETLPKVREMGVEIAPITEFVSKNSGG